MAFKIFETMERLTAKYDKQINDLKSNLLTEAAEDEDNGEDDSSDEMKGVDDMESEQPDPTMPQEGGEDETEPNDYANPEQGVFISDNQKAEFAKMLLTALMSNPPETGTIPSEMMNVSIKNADQVINLIQNYVSMNNETTDNESLDDNMASQLKHAGN